MTEPSEVPPPPSAHPPIPPPPPEVPFFAGAPSASPPVPQQGYPVQGYPPPGYPPAGYPYPYGGPPQYGYGAFPSNSGRAIAVLVLGITSLVLLCGYGVGAITAIVALALAPGARREIETSGGRVIGDGMLRAGVICSWVALGLTLLAILAIIVFLVAGFAFFPSDPAAATP